MLLLWVPAPSWKQRTTAFPAGCWAVIKWEAFSLGFVSITIWAGNLGKESSVFLSRSFLKHASVSLLLGAYFAFLSLVLTWKYKKKKAQHSCSYKVTDAAGRLCSLSITALTAVWICTSRRLGSGLFLFWMKITKIDDSYAISGRVLLQKLAQSCSFASVTLLVIFLYSSMQTAEWHIT